MQGSRKGSLAALIALKLVCCGGLLLALGVVSLGSLLTFIDQPAVQIGGVALMAASVAWWIIAVRNKGKAAKTPTPEESRERVKYPLYD